MNSPESRDGRSCASCAKSLLRTRRLRPRRRGRCGRASGGADAAGGFADVARAHARSARPWGRALAQSPAIASGEEAEIASGPFPSTCLGKAPTQVAYRPPEAIEVVKVIDAADGSLLSLPLMEVDPAEAAEWVTSAIEYLMGAAQLREESRGTSWHAARRLGGRRPSETSPSRDALFAARDAPRAAKRARSTRPPSRSMGSGCPSRAGVCF